MTIKGNQVYITSLNRFTSSDRNRFKFDLCSFDVVYGTVGSCCVKGVAYAKGSSGWLHKQQTHCSKNLLVLNKVTRARQLRQGVTSKGDEYVQFGGASRGPGAGRIQFCGHRTVRGAEGQAQLLLVLVSYCSVPDSIIHHIQMGLAQIYPFLRMYFDS